MEFNARKMSEVNFEQVGMFAKDLEPAIPIYPNQLAFSVPLSTAQTKHCRAYIRTVNNPVAISAPAQMRSMLIQARRSNPTPSFSYTTHATTAVTLR